MTRPIDQTLLDSLMTPADVALRLKISASLVSYRLKSGQYPGIQKGRFWLMQRADVEEIAATRQQAPLRVGRPKGSEDKKPRKRKGENNA